MPDARTAESTDPTVGEELNYYTERFRKIGHKKYESYVVQRVFHRLNDPEIEFVTQQPIRVVKDGASHRYLIDLYFPQFEYAVEIDEEYHEGAHDHDEFRQAEIDRYLTSIPSGEIVDRKTDTFERTVTTRDVTHFDRVRVHGSDLDSFDSQIEKVISHVRELKEKAVKENRFTPFDFGRRTKYDYWKSQGRLSVSDDVWFRTMSDARNMLDGERAGQLAVYDLKVAEKGWRIWFPKLSDPESGWDNQLSEDGRTLVEIAGKGSEVVPGEKTAIFGYYHDPLGATYYKFLGVFEYKGFKPQPATGKYVKTYERISDTILFDPTAKTLSIGENR